MNRPRNTRTEAKTHATAGSITMAVEGMLPEIRALIEAARHRAVTAANLSMVTLYWNIGRVITRDLQQNAKRGGYGERLLERLAAELAREYGPGYSISNLWDMRRFYASFQIPQPMAGELLSPANPQPLAVESGSNSLPEMVDRTHQTPSDELSERLAIDFARHFHLGWTHYRILLGIGDVRQRRFYFEQACNQRWSTRELQRQIAGALF
ncbi:MAG: DUF1016 N-terminal domain-containing protein [Verrucomicrobia bacterium]|nr:DUF1016 N-terminal domain-containing protein [Verrucomicrobiota bacterium]